MISAFPARSSGQALNYRTSPLSVCYHRMLLPRGMHEFPLTPVGCFRYNLPTFSSTCLFPLATGPIWALVVGVPFQSGFRFSEERFLMSPEDYSSESQEPLAASPGRLAWMWAWVKGNRLKAGLIAAGGLLAVGGAAVVWFLLAWDAGTVETEASLEEAFAALDSGAYTEARELAETLREQKGLSTGDLSGTLFVLGAVSCYEAEDSWNQDGKNYYLLASRYLEESRDYGWPPGRRAEGLFLLGKSLNLGGRVPASRAVLLQALRAETSAKTKNEIHWLLAEAYFRDAVPQLDKALEQNTSFLAYKMLSGRRRYEGMLQRARILLEMDRILECLATLEKIPSQAKMRSEAIVMRGRVMIREAERLKATVAQNPENETKARQKFEAAIKTLRQAQGHDTLSNQATRKAMYLIGVCFEGMADYRAALTQYARTRKLFPDSPEALAADVREAELARKLGRDKEVLAAYRRVLAAIGDPDSFSNPWVSLVRLRRYALKTYEHYLQTRNFESSLELAQSFYPLFPRVRAVELTAEAYGKWGHSLLEEADHVAPGKAETLRHEGRLKLRHAGWTYSRLARLRMATRNFPDDLWNSAQSYMDGQDYRGAIRVLREYLKNESRRRHPRALVNLGEAMLAIGNVDKAIEAFEQCIEFHPNDAAAFRARLLASSAFVEKDDLKQAETLLRENLAGDYLTPASTEWRDSLFALGNLLVTTGHYEEAIRRLEEAVARYPDAPQTLEGNYGIANAYRQQAWMTEKQLRKDLGENAFVTESRRVHKDFTEGLDY